MTGKKPSESRMHSEPGPGTFLIVVELPPGLDPDKWMGLLKVVGFMAKRIHPDAYTHGGRVMQRKGKHGGN